MAQSRTASILLAAASATAVCNAQTPVAAGPLVINGSAASGGVATLDVARRVLITCLGNETGHTFTVTGTDRGGNPQRELIAGPNVGSAYSVFDYKSVTIVSISAAANGGVTVGTNAVASTRWVALDNNLAVFNLGVGVNFAGQTGSVQLEATIDAYDKQAVDSLPIGNGDSSFAGLSSSTFVAPVPFPIGTAITVDSLSQVVTPVRAVRITVASGATVSAVRLTVQQQGL